MTTVVVAGLGYVGLPLAMRAAAAGHRVIGYDVDPDRVKLLGAGESYIEDVPDSQLMAAVSAGTFRPSAEARACAGFDVAVITVPTPLRDGLPDLTYIEAAARTLARYLRPGATVIVESTSYPGTTQEQVLPWLEDGSGLIAGTDLHLGYSPERIDPGNLNWTLTTTPKIVSGIDASSLAAVQAFYRGIVDQTVAVSSPREAELAKIIENTFRHVNIALVNEVAMFAHDLGIDVWEAIDAASTKPFGYMPFTPGPGVGGHCLPIDPSYLSWRVERALGQSFRFVELANDINSHMPDYVARRLMLAFNKRGRPVSGARILLLGLAYKKNTVYLAITAALPALWCAAVLLAGGYDSRFIGLGSDEFRRVINAAVTLMAGVVILAYSAKLDLARGYMAIALPSAGVLNLAGRHYLRKRLHRLRRHGSCTRRVIAVGHAAAVAELATRLRRDSYHGLSVVAACLAGGGYPDDEVAAVPVVGDLADVPAAVNRFGADTVAVLACPEMDGACLRELAWELEKTGTDLCVAAALLDVAGPRTTIRPVAGLPLLHLDHPELAGRKQVVKSVFDKAVAATALISLAPLFVAIALAIWLADRGPVFFRQTRVGKDGAAFTLYKFRTMVVDAERRKPLLTARNEADDVLFKIRRDPRITRPGRWLRRWSLDELPQLCNVLLGDMSLVGPRPALPQEAARYGDLMRRRLAVTPGLTGLWQVSGRSDLSWDDAVRLDLRYVENWSLALDLQILWKTGSAVIRGAGAY